MKITLGKPAFSLVWRHCAALLFVLVLGCVIQAVSATENRSTSGGFPAIDAFRDGAYLSRPAHLIVVEGALIRNTMTSSWDNRDDGFFEGYSSFTFEVEVPAGRAGKVLTLSYDKWQSPWKLLPKKRGRRIGMIIPEWALDMQVVSFTEVRRMWLIGPRRPAAPTLASGRPAFSY